MGSLGYCRKTHKIITITVEKENISSQITLRDQENSFRLTLQKLRKTCGIKNRLQSYREKSRLRKVLELELLVGLFFICFLQKEKKNEMKNRSLEENLKKIVGLRDSSAA